jgi:hypothetical protein
VVFLFEVKSCYKTFSSCPSAVFPWKNIWKVKVPPKVVFFVWTAAQGKILAIVEWCCMCKSCGESPNHLVLHCVVAQSLWSLVFCLFAVDWVMPEWVVELLASWMGAFHNSREAGGWGAVPLCLMWVIWRERNQRVFEGI